MTVKLPESIAAYFTADRDGGPDAVAAAFTENGVVTDEGKIHQGRDVIRQWKAGTTQKYTYTMEPFFVATEDGKTQVTCHVAGDFPGSPVDLRFFFVLENDKIAQLEVTV
ncbi:nuclear transport factor 2 family protein [Pseudorhodoferax sp. Leaf274]|uniref:nuclear transport factor 2 family protein n=1 Tax=Pseudorhodoferax sp. Leaf274 TaxID=1736318 RepID=UPI000703A2F1|nr:nuclear transport factor 2 family protein [Pseudorhodoferax sp. Leaf274]KQP39893.1 polyketide cyclase [Pseudorhodoferax sp. Leaf274]